MIEVDAYRRLALEAIGRRIGAVEADDTWFLKRGTDQTRLREALIGRRFIGARRTGKLLMLDVGHRSASAMTAEAVLGLRFGMTGRLVVDGRAGVGELLYTSNRTDPAWVRFAVRFAHGGSLEMHDPRRLGGVELDPDESLLGPDAASITWPELRDLLAGSTTSLKARLLDQSRIAGIGNLIADELLWRAGLDPARAAGSLDGREGRRLHRVMAPTLDDLTQRGGSHLGDLMPARGGGGRCPRDGAVLVRRTLGGRTSWSCPRHQR